MTYSNTQTVTKKNTSAPINAAINSDLKAKPWRLPYWTEQADFLHQQEDQVTEEEPEAEELAMPTAEELENIRLEAYNAGLEQGLVEGRQQGEQQGYQQGLEQGKAEGKRLGEEEGKRVGFTSGEAEGKQKAAQEQQQLAARLNAVISHLQGHFLQREKELPQVISALIQAICQQVVGHELSQGANSIDQFVAQALVQLPGGDDEVKLALSPEDYILFDLDYFKSACLSPASRRVLLQPQQDPALKPGQCRLENKYSLVEYCSDDKLQQLLADAEQQLLREAREFPDADEQQQYQQPLMDDSKQTDEQISEQTAEQRVEASDDLASTSETTELTETVDDSDPSQSGVQE